MAFFNAAVLLVEDDDSIAEPLVDGLARYGFQVNRVGTGAAALAAPRAAMVLLDLGLPDIDGLEVCRQLRRTGDIPVIMLTARGDEADRMAGLELGADDYLAKPFSVRELVARMRAVSRRTQPTPAVEPSRQHRVRTLGRLSIDERTRQVWLDNELIVLGPQEYEVLVLLAAHPSAVVARRHLLDTVWEAAAFDRGKRLDFHVAGLRRKLGNSRWIETHRGVGMRLVPQP
jgi:DNA-binding response OmpR family regulator